MANSDIWLQIKCRFGVDLRLCQCSADPICRIRNIIFVPCRNALSVARGYTHNEKGTYSGL